VDAVNPNYCSALPVGDEAEESFVGEWDEFRDGASYPDDIDEFGSSFMGVTKTEKEFCYKFFLGC
jgi:hypothetical protein